MCEIGKKANLYIGRLWLTKTNKQTNRQTEGQTEPQTQNQSTLSIKMLSVILRNKNICLKKIKLIFKVMMS